MPPDLKQFKNINGKPVTKSCYGSKLSDTWARDLISSPSILQPPSEKEEIKRKLLEFIKTL